MDEETRKKILTLLDEHRIMTIATIRPDGWPQLATACDGIDGGQGSTPIHMRSNQSI
jgi:hypothetical protein